MEFPYSRGLSFYEVNDEGKITSARDIPEPTIKPGDSAIYVRPLVSDPLEGLAYIPGIL